MGSNHAEKVAGLLRRERLDLLSDDSRWGHQRRNIARDQAPARRLIKRSPEHSVDVLDRARCQRPRGLLVLIRFENPSSSMLVIEKGLYLLGGQLRERVAAQAWLQVEIDQLLVAAIRLGPDRRLNRVLQPPREKRLPTVCRSGATGRPC